MPTSPPTVINRCRRLPTVPCVRPWRWRGAPENPARIKLTIGGLLGPDGEPIVYDTSKVTIVEDGVVKGYKITLGEDAGLKADIVFVIDNTASMGPAIAGVRASVLSFLDAIRGSGQDIQAGLIAFNDNIAPGDTSSGVDVTDLRAHAAVYSFHDLTDTYDEPSPLYQQIANLPAVAGGDSPELCFGGLDYARRTFGWRSGAQRIYIVITDITSWGQGVPDSQQQGDRCGLLYRPLTGGTVARGRVGGALLLPG